MQAVFKYIHEENNYHVQQNSFNVSEWLQFKPSEHCSALSLREQVVFRWVDDDVCCVPDQHV